MSRAEDDAVTEALVAGAIHGEAAAGSGWGLISLMLTAPLVGLRKRWPNVLHAVEMEGFPVKTWPNGTARSACGLTGLRLLWSSGPTPWPPRVRGLPEGFTRCAECHEATGRKRPRSEFKPRQTADV